MTSPERLAELNLNDPIRCCHVYPDGHEKAGQRCLGAKARDQFYCYPHSEGGQDHMISQQSRVRARVNTLKDKLTDGQRSIKSEADVQQLTEDVINGILCNVLNKSQAGVLGVFIPVAYKIARDMRLGKVPSSNVTINQDNRKIIIQNLPSEILDQYLTAAPEEKEQILIEYQRRNSVIKTTVRGLKTELKVEPIDVEALPVDAKTIAEISDKTDIPLTKKQVKDLFGKCSAGPAKKQFTEVPPDSTGFGALYEVDKIFHDWKKEMQSIDEYHPDIKRLSYICKRCGVVSPTFNRDYCEEVSLDEEEQTDN